MPNEYHLDLLRRSDLLVDKLRLHGTRLLEASDDPTAEVDSVVFIAEAIQDDLAELDRTIAPHLPDDIAPELQVEAERLLAGIDVLAYALDHDRSSCQIADSLETAVVDASAEAGAEEIAFSLDGLVAAQGSALQASQVGFLAPVLGPLIGIVIPALLALKLALLLWLYWLLRVLRDMFPATPSETTTEAGGGESFDAAHAEALDVLRRIAKWLQEFDALLEGLAITVGTPVTDVSSSSGASSGSSSAGSSSSGSSGSSNGDSSSSSASIGCTDPRTYEEKNTHLSGLFVGNFDIKYLESLCRIIIRVRVLYHFEPGITPAEKARTIALMNRAVGHWDRAAELRCVNTGSCECCCRSVPIEVRLYRVNSDYHKVVDVERNWSRPMVIDEVNVYVPIPVAPLPAPGPAAAPPYTLAVRRWNRYRYDEITFAHEFGHVLGLYDEYHVDLPEALVSWIWHDTRPHIEADTDALMNSQSFAYGGMPRRRPDGVRNYSGVDFRERYFQHIADWVNDEQPDSRCKMEVRLLKTSV